MLRRIPILLTVLVLGLSFATRAFAQGQNTYLVFLLEYPSVQADLGISKAIAAKAKASEAKGNFHKAKSLAEAQTIYKKSQDSVVALLTPKQKARLKEIGYQFTGAMCLGDPSIGKSLSISAEQQKKLGAAYQKRRATYQKVLADAVGNGHLVGKDTKAGQAKVMAARLEMFRGFNADALAILTPSQRSQWRKMQGRPFNVEPLLEPKKMG